MRPPNRRRSFRNRRSVKERATPKIQFDYDKYHRRSIVETVISVEKRVFGDCNTSRSERLRNKEYKLRDVCYNVYRYCKLFILELKGFYRA